MNNRTARLRSAFSACSALSALSIAATFALATAACGVDQMPGDDDGGGGDPPPADGFTRLIDGSWTLPASTEKYVCVRVTAKADTYIQSIRPVAPVGTHHTVLMLGAPDGPDGTTDCTSALMKPAIYASGVGTQPLELPAGVAVHVKPGQQLLLNLHLFNATDTTISGTSGIEILPTEPAAVQHEAGVVLIGKAAGLTVPPNMSTQTGRCTTPANVTMFALAPHMHMLGSHMKVSYANLDGSGARVLMDQAYSFDEQRFASLAQPLVTGAGGKITVECSYFNSTGKTVYFGESSTEEMCYALSFVYPAPTVEQCLQ